MIDVRCVKCQNLLCKAETFIGEIKCRKCKTINTIKIISQKTSCCNHEKVV